MTLTEFLIAAPGTVFTFALAVAIPYMSFSKWMKKRKEQKGAIL
jgi:hypothetical protein